MLTLNRVCVPLGVDCNLRCRYCYRGFGKLEKIPEFSNQMIHWLGQLDPRDTIAVICSGGEPLLDFNRVKAFFSYVPKDIHKKIMTNGTTLTEEIVAYCNNNQIEVSVSHDGENTRWLRGVDILETDKVNLIRKIKSLRIVGVVTSYNNDVLKNYEDTVKKLGHSNFYYAYSLVRIFSGIEYLLEGFDFELFVKTTTELNKKYLFRQPFYGYNAPNRMFVKSLDTRTGEFNILPDGTVCGMTYMKSVYGTINDTREAIKRRALESKDSEFCRNTACALKDYCNLGIMENTRLRCKYEQEVVYSNYEAIMQET